MIILPYKTSATTFDVYIVLEDENLDRMKEADPAQLNVARMGPPWTRLHLSDVWICYALPAEKEVLMQLAAQNRIDALLKHLMRGFKFRPERGDNDAPYTSVRKGSGD